MSNDKAPRDTILELLDAIDVLVADTDYAITHGRSYMEPLDGIEKCVTEIRKLVTGMGVAVNSGDTSEISHADYMSMVLGEDWLGDLA